MLAEVACCKMLEVRCGRVCEGGSVSVDHYQDGSGPSGPWMSVGEGKLGKRRKGSDRAGLLKPSHLPRLAQLTSEGNRKMLSGVETFSPVENVELFGV